MPLMAVNQPMKGNVRLMLDYRELNAYVERHTGDDVTDVCSETCRGWRQMGGRVGVGGFVGCLPSNKGNKGAASCFGEFDPEGIGFGEWWTGGSLFDCGVVESGLW